MEKAMLWALILFWAAAGTPLEDARNRQDRAALEKIFTALAAEADKKPADAEANYRAAEAASYFAETALELRDKGQAQRAAEAGIKYAERAAGARARSEYFRVLGTLCGQVIPANVFSGLKYGKRAQDAVNKAIELDPKSARAHLARGVGAYYLPPALGGGAGLAIRDFEKAIELDPQLAEAYVWLGLALRKENRNADARKAFEKSLQLNPHRLWARQQLEKTPAR